MFKYNTIQYISRNYAMAINSMLSKPVCCLIIAFYINPRTDSKKELRKLGFKGNYLGKS